MKELVEVIAKSLVDYPDQVVVTETENEKAIVLEPVSYTHLDVYKRQVLPCRKRVYPPWYP